MNGNELFRDILETVVSDGRVTGETPEERMESCLQEVEFEAEIERELDKFTVTEALDYAEAYYNPN